MKTLKIGLSAITLLVVSFFLSCSDNELLSTKSTPERYGMGGDKFETLKALLPEDQISVRTPINYIADFCGDVVGDYIHTTANSISNSAYWDYFSFYANKGAVMDIYVKRLSDGMDPAFYLFSGIYSDTDDLPNSAPGYLGFWDDEIAHPSCFSDPYLDNWVVPASGYYTVAVVDFLSCEAAPFNYRLVMSGNNIVIDGCNTGVENYCVEGDPMNELIMDCADGAKNHGQFVKCAAHLTGTWVYEGIIDTLQKDMIMSCVGASDLP